MAVVIRLLGLPFIAGPVDIRHFFNGLTIPDGGVHIIGGKVGEAFIIFATDEDARRAISRSGGFIKDSSVELFLSSKVEMQKTIEMKRTARVGRGRPGSGASGVGNMYHFIDSLREEERHSGYGSLVNQDAGFHTNGTGPDLRPRKTRPLKAENPYLFLRGLPYLVNEDDVRVFFSGLCVDGVILLKHHDGRNNGDAIVKFASCVDASGGLKCHRSFMGSRFIEVMQGSEQQWIEFGGTASKGGDSPRMRSEEHSPSRRINGRHFRNRSHSKSRTRSRSPVGFYVHLKNLSLNTNKRDLRNLFRDTDLSNDQIKFLYKDERRTRYAFVMFKNQKDYNTALGLHKTVLQYRPVLIDPVSRKEMVKILECYEKKRPLSLEKGRPGCVSQKYSQEGFSCSGQKLCIYIRNLPFDVTKGEVQKFFADFSLVEDDIYLLRDDKGVGLGEALVRFKSEEQAMKAERLNRQRFLGIEVLLRLISEEQMQEFGVNFSWMSNEKTEACAWSHDGDDYSCLFDLKDPATCSFGQSESVHYQPKDFRKMGHFKHPQGYFQQSDRRSPEDFRHSPEDYRHPREEHNRRSREEDWRRPLEDWKWPLEDDFRQSREKDCRQLPEKDFRCPWEEDFRRPSQEYFRRSYQEHSRRPPQEHFRHSREEDFRHVADEDFRHPSDEDFRTSEEDLRCPTDEGFRQMSVENFRDLSEKDLRLAESFRSPREDFWTSPDFRGHQAFVNFGHLEGGKFEFGKYNMGNFREGKLMPGLKLNCGSDRIIRVLISNLPFKANANEILDFFHGYKVIPDSVSIQYNEEGLPLGEAIVSMTNYNEALAAVKELSGRPVGPRKVKLSLL
ncbi:RNA-binding protein 12B-B [Apodemus sylvaticus]|uniref:RNA-binding protein 12B-B n=1 Tax=Apodemus sylvaticus TaxID=10129 RepID=UPI002243A921|nr:RNA-binding protein 12B-B [Apodemus sylvaticus]XP_052032063.1 RNA-binding protein 12B-B [Apodemus sylvaticus]XP_052032064.1 RNA-binding protein 12B-B [Apodemus sylvaticus]